MKMVDGLPLDEWIRGNIKGLMQQRELAADGVHTEGDDNLVAAWMSWHDRVLAEG